MLLSIVLTLRPAATYTIPANLGRATHAWFLRQIADLDAAYAAAQHPPGGKRATDAQPGRASGHQQRSFTISNLLGTHTEYDDSMRTVTPADRLLLRVTSLDPELSHMLTLSWLTGLPRRFPFGSHATFHIEGATVDSARHRLAGSDDPVALARKVAEAPPPRAIELDFFSPTVFKSEGQYLPVPLPRLVFGGLAQRWRDSFGNLVTNDVEFGYNETEQILLSGYKLGTTNVHFARVEHDFGLPGFLGRCRFSLERCSPAVARHVALLAHFAGYAGVGKHTAMGLGQTHLRRIVQEGEAAESATASNEESA